MACFNASVVRNSKHLVANMTSENHENSTILSMFYNLENYSLIGHDDRVGRTGGGSHGGVRSRVVSFKTHRPNNRELVNSLALASLDEDIPMIGSNSNNNLRQVVVRGKDKNKWNREWRDNLPMRGYNTGPKNSRSALPLAEGNWYKIIIPYGHKYDKEYVLRTLLNYMTPEVFIPIMVSNRFVFL